MTTEYDSILKWLRDTINSHREQANRRIDFWLRCFYISAGLMGVMCFTLPLFDATPVRLSFIMALASICLSSLVSYMILRNTTRRIAEIVNQAGGRSTKDQWITVKPNLDRYISNLERKTWPVLFISMAFLLTGLFFTNIAMSNPLINTEFTNLLAIILLVLALPPTMAINSLNWWVGVVRDLKYKRTYWDVIHE